MNILPPHPKKGFLKKTVSRPSAAFEPGISTACVLSCSVVSDSLRPHGPPGSSVHGILRTRILEGVAVSSFRDLLNLGIEPTSPALAGRFLTTEPPGKFSSVAQSCLTLCDPKNRSTPGLPVHHQLPESTQTHVHRVGDAIQPSHPLSPPSPPALNLS